MRLACAWALTASAWAAEGTLTPGGRHQQAPGSLAVQSPSSQRHCSFNPQANQAGQLANFLMVRIRPRGWRLCRGSGNHGPEAGKAPQLHSAPPITRSDASDALLAIVGPHFPCYRSSNALLCCGSLLVSQVLWLCRGAYCCFLVIRSQARRIQELQCSLQERPAAPDAPIRPAPRVTSSGRLLCGETSEILDYAPRRATISGVQTQPRKSLAPHEPARHTVSGAAPQRQSRISLCDKHPRQQNQPGQSGHSRESYDEQQEGFVTAAVTSFLSQEADVRALAARGTETHRTAYPRSQTEVSDSQTESHEESQDTAQPAPRKSHSDAITRAITRAAAALKGTYTGIH